MSTRDLLVRTGLLTFAQLNDVDPGNASLAERVVSLGLVAEDALADALAAALHVERVGPEALHAVSPRVLDLVPPELVIEHLILPIAADADTITLAMADPDGEHAAQEIGFFAGRYVLRAIARGSELRAAIEKHYRVRLVAARPPAEPKGHDLRAAR